MLVSGRTHHVGRIADGWFAFFNPELGTGHAMHGERFSYMKRRDVPFFAGLAPRMMIASKSHPVRSHATVPSNQRNREETDRQTTSPPDGIQQVTTLPDVQNEGPERAIAMARERNAACAERDQAIGERQAAEARIAALDPLLRRR